MNLEFSSKLKLETKVKLWRIDIETGAFEIADNVLPATNRLFERYPNAQPWVIRIGHRAVYHFGAWSLEKNDDKEGDIS